MLTILLPRSLSTYLIERRQTPLVTNVVLRGILVLDEIARILVDRVIREMFVHVGQIVILNTEDRGGEPRQALLEQIDPQRIEASDLGGRDQNPQELV